MGDAADMLGRRPLYLATLAVYLLGNIGIELQQSFRCIAFTPDATNFWNEYLVVSTDSSLQSSPINQIKGTFSIAYGVIADILTPAERGSYVFAIPLG